MLLTGDSAGGRSVRNDRWWPLKSLLLPKIEQKNCSKNFALNGQIATVKIGCLIITAGGTPRCAGLGDVMVMAQLLANIAPPTELRPSLTRGN